VSGISSVFYNWQTEARIQMKSFFSFLAISVFDRRGLLLARFGPPSLRQFSLLLKIRFGQFADIRRAMRNPLYPPMRTSESRTVISASGNIEN